MRHQQGYRSGIYSDMYIETTFICYGKGSGEDCWVNLKPGVVKKWGNSLHICTEILKNLDKMRDWETSKDLEFHKKQSKGWIRSDEEDQTNLRDTLKKCINPLDTDVNGLVNIYTEIKVQKSNVYESIKLGEQQCQQLEASLPDGFYNVIKKEVRAMKSGKK